jgi:hypothetical protein
MERGATLTLKPAVRLVLLCLADMANGAKVCWPGQARLVQFTGLAPNTVMVSLRRLADMQLIRVEDRLGFASRYHVLRPDAPANGVVDTPANHVVVTPANGVVLPPQNVPTHPRKSKATPPHDLRRPPPNRGDEPFKNQVSEPLDARDAREGKPAKDSDSGEKASKPAAAPPATPPKAPVLGATPGGGGSQALTIPGRSSDAYLDAPSPDDALPKAEADPLDAPVDPARALAAFAEMRLALRMKAYPPRAAVLSREEQMALCEARPRPKALYLTREQIQATAMTQQFGRTV